MPVKIKTTIDRDGNISIDGIDGVFGPGCKKFSERLKSHGKVVKEDNTDDFYKDGPEVSINTAISES
jgi:hypothetical protein